jgi:hypothetical protein
MTRQNLTDEYSASLANRTESNRRCRGLMIQSRIHSTARTCELVWLGRRDCNQSATPFARPHFSGFIVGVAR